MLRKCLIGKKKNKIYEKQRRQIGIMYVIIIVYLYYCMHLLFFFIFCICIYFVIIFCTVLQFCFIVILLYCFLRILLLLLLYYISIFIYLILQIQYFTFTGYVNDEIIVIIINHSQLNGKSKFSNCTIFEQILQPFCNTYLNNYYEMKLLSNRRNFS